MVKSDTPKSSDPSRTLGSRSAVFGNSIWNIAAFLIAAALSLVTLPFVIAHLGIVLFGFAGLIMACIAPAAIFSSTLTQMLTRELAQVLSNERRVEARQLLGAALLLGICGSTAIFCILMVLGPQIAETLFNIRGTSLVEVRASFLVGAGGWVCQCFAGMLLSLFVARQDYRLPACSNIVASVVTASLIFGLVPWRPQPSTFLACQAVGFVSSLLLVCFGAYRSLKGWLSLPSFHRVSLKRLYNIGSWQVLAQLGGQLSTQTDRYLLGAFLLPQNVGFYNVAQRLEEAVYIGVLKIGETLFPFFSATLNRSREQISDLFFRSSWLLGLVAISALGGLVPVAGDVLRLWTGAAIANEAEHVLVTLCFAGMLGSAANVFSFFLLATGETKALAKLSLITMFATILTGAVALPLIGWPAAGWSSLAGMVAQVTFGVTFLASRLHPAHIWFRISHSLLLPIGLGVLSALVLRMVLAHDALWVWWQVAAWYFISAAAIGFTVVVVSIWGEYGRACRDDLLFVVRRLFLLKVA